MCCNQDAPRLWEIYHDTTHLVNGRDYTAEQCERWAPSLPDLAAWAERLKQTRTFVAVDDAGEIGGFAQLEPGGHIGFFYCRHDRMGQGIGKLLYAAIEQEAKAQGLREITADVSITAKGFFLSRGFEIVLEQEKIVCGAPAPNSVMRRNLLAPPEFRLLDPSLSLGCEYREMLRELWDGPAQTGYMLPPVEADVAEQVEALERESRGEGLAPGRVRQTTWWCQEEGGKFVGLVRLRHELNDFLFQCGGNIGYIVRPSHRGRGVATAMLGLALKKAAAAGLDRVLLTCDSDNEPSRRTIERNGGILDREPVSEKQTCLRYWIS